MLPHCSKSIKKRVVIFTNNKIFGLVDIGQMGLGRYARLVSVIQVLKLRGMRCPGHVACMEETRCIQDFGGKTRGKESTCKTQS
jgi:hypothetical protein